jgi:hypothetical protein
MRQLLVFFWFINSIAVFGQKQEKKWSDLVLNSANTAKDIDFFDAKEKEVVLYLNLVRIDPKLFSETFLKQYLDAAQIHSSYSRSLQKTLEKTIPMEALIPEHDLFVIAREHAIKSGQQNKTGHGDFAKRIKKVESKYPHYIGENCDYGQHSALDIVMRLLIDEGIKNLGHRKNILNSQYHYVGVSIQPHKRYIYNCVIDFGG